MKMLQSTLFVVFVACFPCGAFSQQALDVRQFTYQPVNKIEPAIQFYMQQNGMHLIDHKSKGDVLSIAYQIKKPSNTHRQKLTPLTFTYHLFREISDDSLGNMATMVKDVEITGSFEQLARFYAYYWHTDMPVAGPSLSRDYQDDRVTFYGDKAGKYHIAITNTIIPSPSAYFLAKLKSVETLRQYDKVNFDPR